MDNKEKKRFIAVYVDSNQGNQMPSLSYTPRGYMTQEQVAELSKNLAGTMGCVNAFPTEAHYEGYLREIDEQWLDYIDEQWFDDLCNVHHWDGNDH